MTVSIKQHFNHVTAEESIEHKRIMRALKADLDTLRSNFDTLLAQLDGDAGVTEITYVVDNALDPAELAD